MTIFITDLVGFCKTKKEKRVNEKVESLKKIKEDCANAELELINLQDQLNINKTELLRLQNEQAKEQVHNHYRFYQIQKEVFQ